MPASPPAGHAGQKNPSLRERFQAMRNLPPFLRQVWQTSPALATASLGLRVIRALLPVAMLYVGKLIIDAALLLSRHEAGFPPFDEALYSGLLNPLLALLALEFGLAIASDLLGRIVSYADALLSELFTNVTSIRLMEHAAELDLEDFEDPDLQDKLDRARRQTMGRMNLMSQLFGQVQDAITVASFIGGPAGLRAVADPAAGRGTGAGLHRRSAFQCGGLQPQLPMDARAPPARLPAPDRRQRGNRQGSEDIQPAPVPDRPLPVRWPRSSSAPTAPWRASVRSGARCSPPWARSVTTLAYAYIAWRTVRGDFSIGDLTFLAGSFLPPAPTAGRPADRLLAGGQPGVVPGRSVLVLRDPAGDPLAPRCGADTAADHAGLRVRERRLPLSRCRGAGRCAISISNCAPAKCWPWSARTARARPRW
jgi:ATP-binding cassette subfamily B protein